MLTKTQILKAVETRLKEITIANGYATNIGNNFVYWRDFPLEYDGDEGCTFFDEDDINTEQNQRDQRQVKLRLSAISYMKEDAIEESCNLVGDILRAIAQSPSWGLPCVNTQLKSIEKEIETMGRQACRVEVNVEVFYICDEWGY